MHNSIVFQVSFLNSIVTLFILCEHEAENIDLEAELLNHTMSPSNNRCDFSIVLYQSAAFNYQDIN